MKRHRTLHRQLQSIGDVPDGGWGTAPYSPAPFRAISSGMSPLTETPTSADAVSEIVILETRPNLFAVPPGWRPSLNAYRCNQQFVVFVDLAGVPRDSVKLQIQSGRLVISGRRPAPEPDSQGADTCLLALEIDHGMFERVLELPQAVNPDDVTTEYRDGLFRIALGMRT